MGLYSGSLYKPYYLGVISPGFLNQVPTLQYPKALNSDKYGGTDATGGDCGTAATGAMKFIVIVLTVIMMMVTVTLYPPE